MKLLPVGWYELVVVDTEIRMTRNSLRYVSVEMVVESGEYGAQKVWLNIVKTLGNFHRFLEHLLIFFDEAEIAKLNLEFADVEVLAPLLFEKRVHGLVTVRQFGKKKANEVIKLAKCNTPIQTRNEEYGS